MFFFVFSQDHLGGEPSHHLNHVENHVETDLQQSPSNHLGSSHQQNSAHHHDLFSTHHHHHQFETINFADCPELTEDLADQLVAAVTCSSTEQIHTTNGIVVQSSNLGGISCSGEDLLTPILTTVTSSSAGVVATTTTNAGHPVGTANDTITDHLLMLKEDDACSNSSGVSLNPPCPKNENNIELTKVTKIESFKVSGQQ